jgi:hypothetical protein
VYKVMIITYKKNFLKIFFLKTLNHYYYYYYYIIIIIIIIIYRLYVIIITLYTATTQPVDGVVCQYFISVTHKNTLGLMRYAS